MAQPSVYEQYMIELVNRARENPEAEAMLYGIGLNDGLSPGTITSDSKQPLAPNQLLIDSSRSHSQWMLDTDIFSHTGAGGSSAGDRMTSAGYVFSGSWTWGENIAWNGTTGTLNVAQSIKSQHQSLFLSPGHRTNILNNNFREIGIGSLEGQFTSGSTTYNALMTTQNFAKSGSNFFLTGVAFNDTVTDDSFYTIGEGLAGITIEAVRSSDNAFFSTTTMSAGGYQMALSAGTYDVTFSDNSGDYFTETVTIDSKNVKLDLDTSEIISNPPNNNFFLSVDSTVTLNGLTVTNKDIIKFENNQYTTYFDASDVGVVGAKLDAFDIISNNEILMSFHLPITLNGLSVDDSDIVKFTATSLGDNTAGSFSMYLDGSDVGLTTDGEDIDGITRLSNGNILISTMGVSDVPGINSRNQDEDILLFNPTSLGDNTTGSWSQYFDGSDVGLSDTASEDINGFSLNADGDLLLSTIGNFAVNGVSGQNNDVFVFKPTSLGANTTGNFDNSLFFDGSTENLSVLISDLDLSIGSLI